MTTKTLRTLPAVFVARDDEVLTDGPYTIAEFADVTKPGVRVIDTDGNIHTLRPRVTVLR